MDIRQLTYFIEVAKQNSFTKAAESLHVTQPNLSKMVKNLEKELDVILIDRTTKHIELTDAGLIVLEHAQKVLNSLDDLSSSLDDMMNLQRGKIKIGLPPVIGSLFFPKIIADFRKKYPKIVIDILEYGARKVERSVEEGAIDLGVVVIPVDNEMFDTVPFITERLALIIHPDHPMAAHSHVSLNELKDEPFILFNEEFSLHDRIINACFQAGFKPNVSYVSSQWDFIGGMVRENLGVSILPQSICEKLDREEVRTIPLKDPSIPWSLGIILRKNKYVSFATHQFISHICATF